MRPTGGRRAPDGVNPGLETSRIGKVTLLKNKDDFLMHGVVLHARLLRVREGLGGDDLEII
jgi:hypothetical protein